MKIKGSMKNLKINNAFTVAAAGTALAVIIRLYQVFSGLIDFETGFYNSSDITVYLLYAILALTAISVFAICFLTSEIPQEKMPEKKNMTVAVFAGIFAVTLVIEAVNQFGVFNDMYTSFNIAGSNFIVPAKDRYNLTFFMNSLPYITKSGALPRLCEALFAVLSTVYFLVLAMKYSGLRKFDIAKMKALSLCPLFWATFRLVERFTRTISFMNVSSLFFEMFMIAFMMMFFMYFAQMSSKVNAVAISYKIFSYGLISAMFAAVVALPKIILTVVNSSYRDLMEAGSLACRPEWTDIAFCAFAAAFLVHCLSSARIKNMTLKETEKLIKQEEE